MVAKHLSTPVDPTALTRPAVSVVMANWQGERHIAAAMSSVLAQSVASLELLVADDASDDRSGDLVREAMARDHRVRWLPSSVNAGPSAARNRALDAARGDWVAIIDSDDLVHPRRLELMIEAADRFGADLIADDLAYFGEGPGTGGRNLLAPLGLAGPITVDAAAFVEAACGRRDQPDLGYLKPLIRRAAMGELRYDPDLTIGEDYDFYLRLLLRGLRLVLLPLPTYLYRRHAVSLSHRLSVQAIESLIQAHQATHLVLPAADERIAAAMAQRSRMLDRALSYEKLVEAIKGASLDRATGQLARNPRLLGSLGRSLAERLSRWRPPGEAPPSTAARVALLPDGTNLPPEAGGVAPFDEVLHLPDLSLDGLGAAPRLAAASRRLTGLASRAPLHLVTAGLRGADLLGLAPPWRDAEVWLSEGEYGGLQAPPFAPLRVRHAIPSV